MEHGGHHLLVVLHHGLLAELPDSWPTAKHAAAFTLGWGSEKARSMRGRQSASSLSPLAHCTKGRVKDEASGIEPA